MTEKRILSGTRPTSKLHLGNLLGAIDNWKKFQSKESFYMIADYHVLTTEYASGVKVSENVVEVALDYLAAGLDPSICTIFVQSHVKAHAELALILSMITPLGWLERNPTYKDQIEQLKGKNLNTLGFLGYPVLQAADILLYQADIVPVGEDQLPHLELTREIARRFNHLYGSLFNEPEAALTKAKKLPGLDGRKMSKSYDNCIYISDSEEEIKKKAMQMLTDPGRKRKDDLGNPDVCTVAYFHEIFSSEEVESIKVDCRKAAIGCVDCKRKCAAKLNEFLSPLRNRRETYAKDISKVVDILSDGASKANQIATETLLRVKDVVGL